MSDAVSWIDIVNWICTGASVLLFIFSVISFFRSKNYFKKSEALLDYSSIDKSLAIIEQIKKLLSETITTANPTFPGRGKRKALAISNNAEQINQLLEKIFSLLSPQESEKVKKDLNRDSFSVELYLSNLQAGQCFSPDKSQLVDNHLVDCQTCFSSIKKLLITEKKRAEKILH